MEKSNFIQVFSYKKKGFIKKYQIIYFSTYLTNANIEVENYLSYNIEAVNINSIFPIKNVILEIEMINNITKQIKSINLKCKNINNLNEFNKTIEDHMKLLSKNIEIPFIIQIIIHKIKE